METCGLGKGIPLASALQMLNKVIQFGNKKVKHLVTADRAQVNYSVNNNLAFLQQSCNQQDFDTDTSIQQNWNNYY